MMNLVTRSRAMLAIVVSAAAAALSLPGCNIMGGVAFVVHGPPKAPAAYELADRPTVVFIDDRDNTIPQRADIIRRRIADRTSTELLEHDVVSVVIEPQEALAAAKLKDRYNQVMTLDEIAQSVAAEQLIYVRMLGFQASPDGYTPRPSAVCSVKVWDAVNHVRLFPAADAPETSHPIQIDALPVSPEMYRSRSTLVQVYEILAEQTGIQVAKLFYAHEIRELGSQSDPMRHYN